MMNLFHRKPNETQQEYPHQVPSFDNCLMGAIHLLCRGDSAVMNGLRSCLDDTAGYCRTHTDRLDKRGLQYVPEAEAWLQLVAAVELLLNGGYAVELAENADANAFGTALEAILDRNGTPFSLDRLTFDPQKNIPDWTVQFNEYAGQSGITLYAIDIDSGSFVLGAAHMADYALAADIASEAGIRIVSRP